MIFGDIARKKLSFLALLAAALSFVIVPQSSFAQDATTSVDESVAESQSVADGEVVMETDSSAFEHFGPEMIKGQPTSYEDDAWASMNFQEQYTDNGNYALGMHDKLLMPIITVISLFVLGLLLWVVAKYRKGANPVPSKTSHNTLIEVIWTVVPVIILVVIAVPSITLIARQYAAPPAEAITIKANGYQWYWGYEYVDNGGFEVISNMLDESASLDAGEPYQLAVDNRMVVPVGVPIRLQTFGADVIHSFGIPSLWFKLDAVPGRINEKILTINEEGIYYGQCMELCGARHGYMPIAIEARSMEDYNAWVQAQGGMTLEQIADEAAAAAAAEAAEEDAESAEDAAEAGDTEGEAEAEAAEADAAEADAA
ncbi:cytochrome c oxidase subunit II [Aurantiacibacter sp. D1-12]|uniref:cytochrome c oxidase subunit II n=1 Tax=Aurantiacibacter sp. D1-12 TaxID=2993658 RepID=UPI00237CD1AB|nr:cytochrome c oxidase subunit II [Aurantiacibacter sp. D1-12]MDE1467850.1 cytochrome c oxidase subunit II [Aurantiacibacter sp. D1-12]